MQDVAELLGGLEETSKAFWEQVVNTIMEAVVLINPDRKIVYMNRAAEELVGATLEEVQGVECIKAINCPQCHCVCRLFDEGEFRNIQVSLFNLADQRRRVVLKNGRVLLDKQGQFLVGVETLKDITAEVREREEKEHRMELLFQERSRTQALVDNLDEGVFTMGADLGLREFSKRMEQITGYEAAAVRGRNALHLLGTGDGIPVTETLADLADRVFRTELRTRDGHRKPVEIRFQAIRFSKDELIGLVVDRSLRKDDCGEEFGDVNFQGIISGAESMRSVFRLIEGIADSDVNVLIQGESGTGKELVAQALHRGRQRKSLPFHAVNCATFTGDLLLSELFGHEKGAFTGAVRTKKGRLELAGEGTLLLDEVSEIPLQHQALLLRVLEERTFERVGGAERIEMKARIVAATNVNLAEAVKEGRFREDLYYRLKVIPVLVPPLRERRGDVGLLARFFLRRLAAQDRALPKELSREVVGILERYPWPGNVRELRNIMEYLHLVGGDPLCPADLPAEIGGGGVDGTTGGLPVERTANAADDRAVVISEKERILRALEEARYRRGGAAKLLGIDRSSLWRKMKKYGITIQ
jgi:two-component system response regulator HydG